MSNTRLSPLPGHATIPRRASASTSPQPSQTTNSTLVHTDTGFAAQRRLQGRRSRMDIDRANRAGAWDASDDHQGETSATSLSEDDGTQRGAGKAAGARHGVGTGLDTIAASRRANGRRAMDRTATPPLIDLDGGPAAASTGQTPASCSRQDPPPTTSRQNNKLQELLAMMREPVALPSSTPTPVQQPYPTSTPLPQRHRQRSFTSASPPAQNSGFPSSARHSILPSPEKQQGLGVWRDGRSRHGFPPPSPTRLANAGSRGEDLSRVDAEGDVRRSYQQIEVSGEEPLDEDERAAEDQLQDEDDYLSREDDESRPCTSGSPLGDTSRQSSARRRQLLVDLGSEGNPRSESLISSDVPLGHEAQRAGPAGEGGGDDSPPSPPPRLHTVPPGNRNGLSRLGPGDSLERSLSGSSDSRRRRRAAPGDASGMSSGLAARLGETTPSAHASASNSALQSYLASHADTPVRLGRSISADTSQRQSPARPPAAISAPNHSISTARSFATPMPSGITDRPPNNALAPKSTVRKSRRTWVQSSPVHRPRFAEPAVLESPSRHRGEAAGPSTLHPEETVLEDEFDAPSYVAAAPGTMESFEGGLVEDEYEEEDEGDFGEDDEPFLEPTSRMGASPRGHPGHLSHASPVDGTFATARDRTRDLSRSPDTRGSQSQRLSGADASRQETTYQTPERSHTASPSTKGSPRHSGLLSQALQRASPLYARSTPSPAKAQSTSSITHSPSRSLQAATPGTPPVNVRADNTAMTSNTPVPPGGWGIVAGVRHVRFSPARNAQRSSPSLLHHEATRSRSDASAADEAEAAGSGLSESAGRDTADNFGSSKLAHLKEIAAGSIADKPLPSPPDLALSGILKHSTTYRDAQGELEQLTAEEQRARVKAKKAYAELQEGLRTMQWTAGSGPFAITTWRSMGRTFLWNAFCVWAIIRLTLLACQPEMNPLDPFLYTAYHAAAVPSWADLCVSASEWRTHLGAGWAIVRGLTTDEVVRHATLLVLSSPDAEIYQRIPC